MSGNGGFAAALRDPASPAPAGLTTWNGSDPAHRFSVYRNNVAVALIDALAATFPVVAALCGEAFFRAMARQYALASPPRSPLLAEFGQDFPDFIASYAPADGVAYLAPVARLEAARAQVWHAADAVPVTAERLAAAQGWIGDAVLTLHPAHAVLAAPYAIVSIWAAHNGMGDLSSVDVEAAEEALVVRPELDTEVWRLPPGGAAFITGLGAGVPVAEAAFAALAANAGFDAAVALNIIVAARLVTDLTPGGPA
jgi:hypothetical protein